MPIEAIIFDMDGLLIDSEPSWRHAEITIFNRLGVPLTEKMTLETVGLRLDEVVRYWFDRFQWDSFTESEVEEMILSEMAALHNKQCILLPGVLQTLEFFHKRSIPMAIASSSHPLLISTAIEKTGIAHYLSVIQSGYQEYYSKPNPEIFLSAAAKLNVMPTKCLVFEDSFNGMIAALAARMKVVAVPDQSCGIDPRFICADLQLATLEAFTPDIWSKLNI